MDETLAHLQSSMGYVIVMALSLTANDTTHDPPLRERMGQRQLLRPKGWSLHLALRLMR